MDTPDLTPDTRQGCLTRLAWVGAGGVLALTFVAGIYMWGARQRDMLHVEHAREVFAPALKAPEALPEPIDLDATIRVIHGIDLALRDKESFDTYMLEIAKQDYRGVDPEVLEARRALFEVLRDLYALQTEAEDQQELWELTSELMLSTLSVVEVEGEANLVSPSGSLGVDQAQARKLLDELKQRREDKKRLMKAIDAHETELFEALVRYSDVYYGVVEEWDRLSVLRDRAWLAAHDLDWKATEAAARLAMAKEPQEREAHLLAALAMIENGNPEDAAAVEALLTDYMDAHPERTAPALLLMGVHQAKQGDVRGAQLSFQQSAAEYPKQAELLADMLDPYNMRTHLKKSREGGFIVDQYKASMLGGGRWSPDLQLAKLHFERGDDDAGRAKVLDHFARRRNQKAWDLILHDIAFCHDLLGPHFWELFPEETYLDLEVSPTLLSDGLKLAIDNRSPRTLRNATLVLGLHFTDMFAGEYIAVPAEKTVPAVVAHEVTDFGAITIDQDMLGVNKGVGDIVQHRAVLISNEAVSWVDTDEYKIAEAAEFRRQKRLDQAQARAPAQLHPTFSSTVRRLLNQIPQNAEVHIEHRMGADDVVLELPRELSVLRPLFRLQHQGKQLPAEDNRIEGDHISLRFKAVDSFTEGATPGFEVLMASPFGDVRLQGRPGSPITWTLE